MIDRFVCTASVVAQLTASIYESNEIAALTGVDEDLTLSSNSHMIIHSYASRREPPHLPNAGQAFITLRCRRHKHGVLLAGTGSRELHPGSAHFEQLRAEQYRHW